MIKPREHGSALFFVVLLVGVVVIAGIWMLRPQPSFTVPASPQPPIVDVMLAQPQTYQSKIKTQGTIEPRREINLVAQVSGQVIAVSDKFVDGGQFVAGETLVTLDDRDYRFTLVNAESQVANAERELALEKGQARQAKREWRDLGSAEANALFLRKPQVNAAELALKAAKAERDRAALNVQRTNISAPFAGRVQGTSVDLGQFVSAGTAIASVYDSDRVEVRLPLNNEQMALSGLFLDYLSLGNEHPVTLSATIGGRVYQWQGEITRMAASIDSATRFFNVIVEVKKPFDTTIHDQPLFVGLFVEAEIKGNVFEGAIRIPKKAIMDNYVFLVDEQKKLVAKSVSVIDKDNLDAWVQADIASGEQIVVSDPRVLRENMHVRVNKSAE